jgi:hypothetical protein
VTLGVARRLDHTRPRAADFDRVALLDLNIDTRNGGGLLRRPDDGSAGHLLYGSVSGGVVVMMVGGENLA